MAYIYKNIFSETKSCLPPKIAINDLSTWWIKKYDENGQSISVPYIATWAPDKREWYISLPGSRLAPTMTPEELIGYRVLGEAIAPGCDIKYPSIFKGFYLNILGGISYRHIDLISYKKEDKRD